VKTSSSRPRGWWPNSRARRHAGGRAAVLRLPRTATTSPGSSTAPRPRRWRRHSPSPSCRRRAGAGGAFVLAQRWVHDLTSFHAQPRPIRKATIGRTKPDSIELDDKPPTAHIARVVIEEDGRSWSCIGAAFPTGASGSRASTSSPSGATPRAHQDAAPLFARAATVSTNHLTTSPRP